MTSPLIGQADIPENDNKVTITLENKGEHTNVKLNKENNASQAAKKKC